MTKARSLANRAQDFVTPEDYGAKGDGVASDYQAFFDANATGTPIRLRNGKNYVIDKPLTIGVSMVGAGEGDSSQTKITLTNTGTLIVGAWGLHWAGFRVYSAVASKTFITCNKSYWTFERFWLEGVATSSQIGVAFDATLGSVYFADLTKFKIKYIDKPFTFTGPTGGSVFESINALRIGASLRDDIQEFVTAYTVTGDHLVFNDNFIAAYLENAADAAQRAFNITGTSKFRDNRITLLLDMVPTLITNDVDIKAPNWWEVRTDNIIKTGAGLLTQQVWQNNKARFRAYRSADLNLTDATFERIGFDAVTFDEGGNIDGNGIPTGCYNVTASPITNTPFAAKAAYSFTAINAMKLFVTAQADVSTNLADQDRVRLAIYKNAAAVAESSDYASGVNGCRVRVQDIVDLAPGDTVSIWCWANQAAGSGMHIISGGSAATYFTGHEL